MLRCCTKVSWLIAKCALFVKCLILTHRLSLCRFAYLPSSEPSLSTKLLRSGIVVSTLIERWNFIPLRERERFSVEHSLLSEHLLLPVSEFLCADDMAAMVRAINEIL